VHARSAESPRPTTSRARSGTRRSAHPRETARRVARPVCTNGRKGPSYDWHALLVPCDAVFEASLQTLLGAHGRRRVGRYA